MYTLTVFADMTEITSITADTLAEAYSKAENLRLDDFFVVVRYNG